MATVDVRDATLRVRFTRAERLAGLVRDLDVHLRHVGEVDVVADGLRAVHGLRAPGLALPGRRKVGTWRGRGRKALVSVQRDRPAVRIRLAGERYDELVLAVDEAVACADRIVAAATTTR